MRDDTRTPERCDVCRFDGAHYTDDDVAGTLRNIGEWVAHTVVGVPAEVLASSTGPTGGRATGSPLDDIRDIRETLVSTADIFEGVTGHTIGSIPRTQLATSSVVDHELAEMNAAAKRLTTLWAEASKRTEPAGLDDRSTDLGAIIREASHRSTHAVSDLGRRVVDLGAGTPAQTATVTHIHTSGGGVPKLAVASATIGYRGLDGDRQSSRRHHGRVWQAVSLWSSEVIEALRSEGHPIAPGLAGENITISGTDWATIRPGARFDFGESGPLLEATGWATPCSNLAPYFVDRDVRRIDVDHHPGFSRLYAKVLRDGTVNTDESVRVF